MIGLTEPALERLAAEQLLAIASKGRGEIRITRRFDAGGATSIVFRLWQCVGGELLPTKIGFALSVEQMPQFACAVGKALEEIGSERA